MCLIRVRAKLCRSGPDLRMAALNIYIKVFLQWLHIMMKDVRLTTLGCWREKLGMKCSFPGWNEWPLTLTVRHQGGHKVRSSIFLWSLRTWGWQQNLKTKFKPSDRSIVTLNIHAQTSYSLHVPFTDWLTVTAGVHQIDLPHRQRISNMLCNIFHPLVLHYLIKSETLKLCCMQDVLLVGTVCHSEGCAL